MEEKLNSAQTGEYYIITSAPEITLLRSLGVRMGDVVYKKYNFIFKGPTLIQVDTREVALSDDIASQICIRKIKQ